MLSTDNTTSASVNEQMRQCLRQCAKLRLEIEKLNKINMNYEFENWFKKLKLERSNLQLQEKRVLNGHFGKIYGMQWSNQRYDIVSASQDGQLIIWDAFKAKKRESILLTSSWVMTCSWSPTGYLVASGGLDNICTIHRVNCEENNSQKPRSKETNQERQKANQNDGDFYRRGAIHNEWLGNHEKCEATMDRGTFRELSHHEGYISCCRFINDEEILTSSGDSTCILWDVEKRLPKITFSDHIGDIMGISLNKGRTLFVSGSCDSTAKVFDPRSGPSCNITFTGHMSDINAVKFFPNGKSFCTGSDDSSCMIFDLRARCQIGYFTDEKNRCGVTSVCFSSTGKFMFSGNDSNYANVWDVPTNELICQLFGHSDRVAAVDLSADGTAVCTASWDKYLKIWSI